VSSGRYFVASRSLEGFRLVEIDGLPLVENFQPIHELIRHRCGPEIASLFAEPVISRGNGATPTRIDWYASCQGAARPLSDLDASSATELRRQLEPRLAGLRALTFDPQFGPYVAGVLNVASPDAVLDVGGKPLLIDWGLLPESALTNERGREAHFAATLGQFAPTLPVPPLSREEWAALFEREPAQANLSIVPPALPVMAHARLVSPGAWSSYRAPVIACTIAFAILLILLIPGVLIYPGHGYSEKMIDGALNDALRARQAQLRAALGADCGELPEKVLHLIPASLSEVRVPVPGEPHGSIASGSASSHSGSSGDGEVSTSVSSTQGRPASSLPVTSMDLAARIERGVVIVLAGTKTGTAFFVAPDKLVTNRHVIEGEHSIAVAGRAVGIVPARVVNLVAQGTLDFAVLQVAPQSNVLPFSLATQIQVLAPVAAAGFPALYLDTDPVFSNLRSGDVAAAQRLSPVLTTGVVNHLQRYDEDAITLVLHGAEIAPGNSGGPLVDYCGRVVGVNTFGRADHRLALTARYALGADGLQHFLALAAVAFRTESTPCEPQLVTMLAPEGAASTQPGSGAVASPSTSPSTNPGLPASRPPGAPAR
jgi:S1-C subfamily serine protease